MSNRNFIKQGCNYLTQIWKSVWDAEDVNVPLIQKRIKSTQAYDLNDCSYPSFSDLLPYRYFDKDTGIFFNKQNAGIIYQIVPLTGANETIAEQLDDILRSKVADEFTLQMFLVKHNQVGYLIDDYAHQFDTDDFSELRHIGKKLHSFYLNAARHGFKTKDLSKPSLKHTECFVVIDCVKDSELEIKAKLSRFRVAFEAALSSAKIGHIRGNVESFLRLGRFFLAHNPDEIYPQRVDYQEEEPLHYQMTGLDFDCEIQKEGLLLTGANNKGKSFETAVSVLTIDKLPANYHLWYNVNNNNFIFEKGQNIPCNHIISVIYKVDKQASALTRANRKTRDLDKKAKSEYAIQVAGTEEQAKTWRAFREDLASHKTKAVKMLYNVILFSRPHEKSRDIEAARTVFSYNHITLSLIKHMTMPYFLVSMPFMFTNHLAKDFSLPRMMWPISSWNATQYMPVISDWQGLSKGILMPTMRDQFNLLNPFDDSLGTNFNMAITGTSGGGKSFAIQMMMLNVLFNGGDVFVIDIGGSYKKLCHTLGGNYLEYENLAMNPFTHVKNIFDDIDDIVDLFELLACSRSKASDDDRGTLREAVMESFDRQGSLTCIDDICAVLQQLFENEPDTYPTARILAKNLKRYCKGAEHGRVFNSPSKLNPHARIIVIDLKSIEDNAAIRGPVLLSVISQIQRRMFDSNRSRQKMCIIDEAWKFFTGDVIATQFITKGFRTGRRHKASFVTITQGIADYYKFDEARAAWDNSAIKMIFLQDQASLLEHNKQHETFSEYEIQLLRVFPKAKDAGYSQVLIKAGGLSSFHRLFVDPFTRVMLSSDGDDYTAVERYVSQGMRFVDAVSRVAEEQLGVEHV
ncbi:type-IV secretion system protein TraC [Legionella busanensis]|uniref:Type-IV secretion system protein TraC n=1 Tax=Legionella busanensis TaxID=190655 RepID=A0A378K9R1_9GAMM|nr:type IV secretion system protein TraC [Legionella busanensis]STX81259.1 type-IV secretion system protein TraC [Legionella busanensis]